MKHSSFFLASLAVAAAVSCDTLKQDQGTDIFEGGEIAFVTHIEGTKAFTETLNSTLEANGWNCRAVIDGVEPGELFNKTLTFAGGVFRDPDITWHFPSGSETTSFYGVYPTSLTISPSNTITYIADYEADIVTAKNEGVARQDNAVSMHFSHILSQMDVKMKGADPNTDYVLQFFSVTSPSGGTYDIVNDAWTLDATSEKSSTLVTTSVPTDNYVTVVNPMTFLPGAAHVRITWKSYTKGTTTLVGTYEVNMDVNLDKGVHTTLNIILSDSSDSSILASSTVSPWMTASVNLNTGNVAPPVNLAMVKTSDGSALASECTANCYVVRANGKYKIPLVYGNAIKNGKTNTSAFYNAKTQTKFEDSYGTAFTEDSSPYIKDHASAKSKSIKYAEVLWIHGDAKIDIVGVNNDYLTIGVNSFSPSNALVAVKDEDGTILWSWHLWLTNQDLSPVTITGLYGINFQIMPVALGWNGWTTETVNGVAKDRSTAPYYQWGRKDPFIPVNSVAGASTFEKNTAATYQMAHNNPTTYYFKSETQGWLKGDLEYNYPWGADNTSSSTGSPVVKTIYDPCPAGWNVPQHYTFRGFTTTGDNSLTPSEFNVINIETYADDKGWKFMRNSADTEGIYFPATGCRYNSNVINSNVGQFGYYWLSVPYDSTSGKCLGFGSGNVKPQGYNHRFAGYCVWPALSAE